MESPNKRKRPTFRSSNTNKRSKKDQDWQSASDYDSFRSTRPTHDVNQELNWQSLNSTESRRRPLNHDLKPHAPLLSSTHQSSDFIRPTSSKEFGDHNPMTMRHPGNRRLAVSNPFTGGQCDAREILSNAHQVSDSMWPTSSKKIRIHDPSLPCHSGIKKPNYRPLNGDQHGARILLSTPHQTSDFVWPTYSGNHVPLLECHSDAHNRVPNKKPVVSSAPGDQCDAREILNTRKRHLASDGANCSTRVDLLCKRQKTKLSQVDSQRSPDPEVSLMNLLKRAVKLKRPIDAKTTEKVIEQLHTKSGIQYELLIKVIQALCNGNVTNISKYLFASSTFWHHINVLVCSMPQEKNKDKRSIFVKIIEDITILFKKLLEARPFKAVKHLPIDSCCGTVDQLSRQDFLFRSVEESVAQLRTKRDEIRQELFDIEEQKSVNDMLILPTEEELHNSVEILRENIVKGPFPSNIDYISIFYSLLREDFIQPLREALSKIHQQFLYENVTLSVVESFNDEIKCQLNFKTKRKVSWQYSKKLMYGCLLCLSDDDFATTFFATVSERDLDDLKKCCITVTLIGLAAENPKYVSSYKVYKMFESPCYYEAYAPIIRMLHSLRENPSNLPFEDYFVSCKTNIRKPRYLEQNPEAKVSLHNVICSCDPQECQHNSFSIEDIEKKELNNSCCVSFNLDPSQSKALCTALTKELVLIQGPPGTGKTYIGLKIVQSFLINKKLWNTPKNKPIMVVCYTNHALDQFLEGLVKMKDDFGTNLKIRRVGGRSKSTILEPYNVKQFINMMKRQKGIRFSSKKSSRRMESRIKHLSEFLKGSFSYSKETVAVYSFFLSEAIIDELEHYCHFTKMILPAFPKLVSKAVEENPFHDQIESERHFSLDDDQYSDSRQLFERQSLKTFVLDFQRIRPLSKVVANETFLVLADGKIENHLHLQLFKYCLNKLLFEWQQELNHVTQENAENDRHIEMIRVRCLQDADVVGLTINGAAKLNTALTQVQSKICLIEEAGEVLEPHVITSLTGYTQQLILIGDHKQLRPKTNCDDIGRKYKLNISLFERLVDNDFPVVTLKTQHRMRPEISCLVSNHVYDGCIEDSESVQSYENVKGMLRNMYFISHHVYETRDEDESSPFNIHEATFMVHLSKYLIQNGHKSEDITIITPYLGQLRQIKEQSKKEHVDVKISTVDNFQGEENDIILLSLVRSNKEEDIGFTRFKNRVCVAMSRAKKGFYCIGNFSIFRKKSKVWSSILIDLEKDSCLGDTLPLQCITHSKVTSVSNAADIEKVLSDGCGEQCNIRLPICNHVCNRLCHPDDQAHEKNCPQPCPKRCIEGLHRCADKCGSTCPPCKKLVEKTIPMCGHKQQVDCHIEASHFSCKVKCQKMRPCGHQCKLLCGQDCSSEPCKHFVTKLWPCGHEAQTECHISELKYSEDCDFPCNVTLACDHKCSGKCGKCRQGRLHVPCKEKCTRLLVCGHPCSEPCAKNCKPCAKKCDFKCPHAPCRHTCSYECKPCPHLCEWKCKHFRCSRNCGEQCDRKRCSEPCKKKLQCKHTCIGVCGEPCPNVCRICNKDSSVFETFFGGEDDPDSRFIELKDCKHVIEATALDRWIDTGNGDPDIGIMWKTCPICKVPVISTLRYANQANKVRTDMNNVKKKESCVLSKTDRNEHRAKAHELSRLVYELLTKSQTKSITDIGPSLTEKFNAQIRRWKKFDVMYIENDALLTDFLILFQSLHRSLLTLQSLGNVFSSKTMARHEIKTIGIEWLNSQTKGFLKWLLECLNRNSFTDQVRLDSCAENRRIFLLGKLYHLKYRYIKADGVKLSESENATLCSYKQYECFGCKPKIPVTDNVFEQVLSEVNSIAKKCDHPLSTPEKSMIIKAIGAKKGSWYKCQNGHFYQIGECGGAMAVSKCPECSAIIGGERHSLAPGNQHAGEFDDSTHAAWSEGANLANYEGLN